MGHRSSTVLVDSAQNPHGYVNIYPFIPAEKSWTELAITARVLRNNLCHTSASVPQPSWDVHAFLPVLGFSDCADVYLGCRNTQGSQAAGRMQTSLVQTVISLIRIIRKESVKCHLVSCSQLICLTQGVVGGAYEGEAITSLRGPLRRESSHRHPMRAPRWGYAGDIRIGYD